MRSRRFFYMGFRARYVSEYNEVRTKVQDTKGLEDDTSLMTTAVNRLNPIRKYIMKYLLSLILVLFSFNTYAFECNDQNTRTDRNYLGQTITPMDNFFNPTTDSILHRNATNVKTYCVHGDKVLNESKHVLSVVQEGDYQDKKGQVHYMFNFTQGYGVITYRNEQGKMWWHDGHKNDWFVMCQRDEFTDEAMCSFGNGGLRYYQNDKGQIRFKIGIKNYPQSQSCIRLDKREIKCVREDLNWEPKQDYRLMAQAVQLDTIRINYRDPFDREVNERFSSKGLNAAWTLTNQLISQLKEVE